MVLGRRCILPPLSHAIMLNGYAKVPVPFNGDTAFAGPVDTMAFISSFFKFSPAFVEHKDMCTPLCKPSRFGFDLWIISKGVFPPSVHIAVLFFSQVVCWSVSVHRNLGRCHDEHSLRMLQEHTIEMLGDYILLWGVMHCEVSYSAA